MIQTFKQGKKNLFAKTSAAAGSSGPCNCLVGTAYLDAGGGCNCSSNANLPPFPFNGTEAEQISWRNEYLGGGVNPIESEPPPPGTGGVKAPAGMKWTPAGWVPLNTKAGNTASGAEENTIFGFSPWVVLGAAAVGLWILSSMDGRK